MRWKVLKNHYILHRNFTTNSNRLPDENNDNKKDNNNYDNNYSLFYYIFGFYLGYKVGSNQPR